MWDWRPKSNSNSFANGLTTVCGQLGALSSLAKAVCGSNTTRIWSRLHLRTSNGTVATSECPSKPLHRLVQAFHWMNSWSWYTHGKAVTTIEEGLRDAFTCANDNSMKVYFGKVPHIVGMKFSRFVNPLDEVGHALLAPNVLRFLGQSRFIEERFVDVRWHR